MPIKRGFVEVGPYVAYPFDFDYTKGFLKSLVSRGPGLRKFTIDGKTFLSSPSFFRWNYRMLILLKKHAFSSSKIDPTIIDVGANIGLGLVAAKRQYPKAKIWALEPDPDLFDVLQKNISSQRIESDVTLVRQAAWVFDGTLEFEQLGTGFGRIAGADPDPARLVKVPCIDFARFLDTIDGNFDLLKIDIEGAEVEVLPHITDHLPRCSNVVLEIHCTHNTPADLPTRLLTLLQEAGLGLRHVEPNTWPSTPLNGCTAGPYSLAFDAYFSRT